MTETEKIGVLLLAHGSPDSLEDVPEFLLRVTGGRPLPEESVEEIKHRYGLIGRSPLTALTLKQGEFWRASCAFRFMLACVTGSLLLRKP